MFDKMGRAVAITLANYARHRFSLDADITACLPLRRCGIAARAVVPINYYITRLRR